MYGLSRDSSIRTPIDRPIPRLISAMELLLITVGYFTVVWLIAPKLETNGLIPFTKVLLIAFFLYVSFFSPTCIHKDSLIDRGMGDWRTLFVRTDNIVSAYKYYLVLTLVGAGAIVSTAWLHNPQLASTFSWQAWWLKLCLNFFNALGQDLLFLSFIMPRIKEICPFKPVSKAFGGLCLRQNAIIVSLGCTILFTLFHLPNWPLMIVVFISGFAIAIIFFYRPNLFLAVLTHAILGTLLHRVIEMHMRIGPFYWESDKYVYRTLFPAPPK